MVEDPKIYKMSTKYSKKGLQEDPTIIWWKIYYGNYTTWTSNDGPWKDAPDKDIQVVLLWRADKNTRIFFGRDYYCYNPKEPLYNFSQTNNLSEAKGQVKTGSWAGDWDFQKILWEALLDERELYYPGVYDRNVPPMPDYLLIDSGK